MPIPFKIDFRNPDYVQVFEWRAERLARIRADLSKLPALYSYYRLNPIDFIEDWGMTFDPRNAGGPIPAAMPFILFPRQREWLEWVIEHRASKRPGVTPKSRDVGISWLASGLSATLCNFEPNVVIGFGSRKEEYVDKTGSPKALFWKIRQFMRMLPYEFRNGWEQRTCSAHLRINFPATGSYITGEAGDNIGRGDRTTVYFVDESAHLERPMLVEAALSATTDCRIDMSSMNGSNKPFAEKVRSWAPEDVFRFSWRDDPRKDDAWYEKMQGILDAVTIAQEIDMNENASVEGIVIPNIWVQAAVGSFEKLGIKPTGAAIAALDVADEGVDQNALCLAKGMFVEQVSVWSGKDSDIYATTEKAFGLCDDHEYREMRFEEDGLGAGVRGDARVINEMREAAKLHRIEVEGWKASHSPVNPEDPIDPDVDPKDDPRTNEDFFLNAKAQGWWNLRRLFRNTYRAVVLGMPFKPDDIIGLNPHMEGLSQVLSELSQPTYTKMTSGKIMIDKKPEGAKSPNRADSIMIRYAPIEVKPRGFFDL